MTSYIAPPPFSNPTSIFSSISPSLEEHCKQNNQKRVYKHIKLFNTELYHKVSPSRFSFLPEKVKNHNCKQLTSPMLRSTPCACSSTGSISSDLQEASFPSSAAATFSLGSPCNVSNSTPTHLLLLLFYKKE